MHKTIAVIRGDGIGPEIIEEALKAMRRVAEVYGHCWTFVPVAMGGCAIDQYGEPLPKAELQKCMASDSVLLGAVGGAKWEQVEKSKRPERGLLHLRSAMGLYANLRPAKLFVQLTEASPLRADIVQRGIDLLVVRELIGGVYFGEHRTESLDGELHATDLMPYAEHEVERIAHIAFNAARKRRGQIISVDKANVLDTSRLWRTVMHRVATAYPDVAYQDMLVDNAAMQLVRDPSQFDVLVTENLFGDILSDEASMITGSIGMIPSASLGSSTCGLYEPIHGSAPDIAGQNKANPIGTVLSAAMMLRYAFDMQREADAIERAVADTLDDGYRTADLYAPGMTKICCDAMGDQIATRIV